MSTSLDCPPPANDFFRPRRPLCAEHDSEQKCKRVCELGRSLRCERDRDRPLKATSGRPAFALFMRAILMIVLLIPEAFTLGYLTLGLASFASAEDAVTVANSKDARLRQRMTGEIVEYTGETLKLRRSDGRDETIPAARVLSFETTWPPQRDAGLEQMRRGDYSGALVSLRAATQAEQRPWAQRRLLAAGVDCLRELGQYERAGEAFISLYRGDPTTAELGVIPLPWLPPTPDDRRIETKAQGWSADRDSPAAQLLGAAWLVALGQRAAPFEQLRRLTTHSDARIALLAEAQLWRAKLVSVSASDVESWERQVERLPPSVRAGPYFVIGEAWSRLDAPQRAALAYLRVPLQFGEQRRLAAAARSAAATQLDKLGQADAAQRLRDAAAGPMKGDR